MESEIMFLMSIRDYCDNMKAEVGMSILDDFNKLIKSRIVVLIKQGGENEN